MGKGNPRLGTCLCGSAATVRDTKASDGRLHFVCHEITPEGRSKHFGFVDASEAGRLEAQVELAEERSYIDQLLLGP